MIRHSVGTLMAIVAVAPMGPALQAQRVTVAENRPVVAAVSPKELLARPVTIVLNQVPLTNAINSIAAQANVQIDYRTEILEAVTRPITLRAKNLALGTVLDSVLAGTMLRAVVTSPDGLTLTRMAVSAPQQGVLAGKIVNAKTKAPVRSATVTLDNASSGVVTDESGAFRVSAAPGEHTVAVRAVGFVKQSKRVVVSEGGVVAVEFALDPSASVLDEVIVTGTVVATERKAIPTPITVITAQDIEQRGITRIDQLFRGEVPGVIALDQGSAIYQSTTLGANVTSRVFARGASSVNGAANPLKTYVDGVELLDASYLGTIDPKSIERVEIITGPQAATIYGSGAMGGVMQIFTKKGSGRSTPDLTLSVKYGMLENSLSTSRAPAHNDALSIAGGTGPQVSYAGTLSHEYTGQWRPDLYSRRYGASAGVTLSQGPVVASGSATATAGSNGTYPERLQGLLDATLGQSGVYGAAFRSFASQIRSTNSSQTVSLNVDYRATSQWQHHLTVGRSQTNFDLVPQAPIFYDVSDSLYSSQSSSGQRTTAAYNMTFLSGYRGIMSNTLTLGFTGSSGSQTQVAGCLTAPSSSTYISCGSSPSGGQQLTVQKPLDDQSWGGFGSVQAGLFDQFFLTAGLRGERNPNYGREHSIDWTPTYGATYSFEYGDLTLKLLGSYGRSTRAPGPNLRLQHVYLTGGDPAQIVDQLANPNLTPEYSRGPQGGLELYYGNVGSFTLNHYQQTVSGLIQSVAIDSVYLNYPDAGYGYYVKQSQNGNVAKVQQRGWEGTGALNFGPLSLKGTYSWTDSRVLAVSNLYAGLIPLGSSFLMLPTRAGNVTATYAHGGTSITLVTNMIGPVRGQSDNSAIGRILYYDITYSRLRMYLNRVKTYPFGATYIKPGYAKTDLAVSQRITPWASLTVNVVNIGNSYGTEASSYQTPALGRTSTLGLTLRWPTGR